MDDAMIQRERAAEIAEGLSPAAVRQPGGLSAEFCDGWMAACEAIAEALRNGSADGVSADNGG